MRSLIICAVLSLFAGDALAGKKGSCHSAASITSDVWKYAGPILTTVLDNAGPQAATAAQIMRATDKAIRAWNKLVAGNGWAKIGPRRLDFNERHQGTLVGVTERVFVSAVPAFKPVTIDFYKRGGKGRVKVVVCKVDRKNRAHQVAAFEVDKTTKDGKVRSIKIADAPDHVIKVVLHGKNAVRKLQYAVKARM